MAYNFVLVNINFWVFVEFYCVLFIHKKAPFYLVIKGLYGLANKSLGLLLRAYLLKKYFNLQNKY